MVGLPKRFDIGSDRSTAIVLPKRRIPFAIYFLIRDNVVVYVGQSINMLARIGMHFDGAPSKYGKLKKIKERKLFDSAEVIDVEQHLMNATEAFFIMYYHPEYNFGMPFQSDHRKVKNVAKTYGCELCPFCRSAYRRIGEYCWRSCGIPHPSVVPTVAKMSQLVDGHSHRSQPAW